RNKRIQFHAAVNHSYTSDILLESILRVASPRKGFHTAKTLSRPRPRESWCIGQLRSPTSGLGAVPLAPEPTLPTMHGRWEDRFDPQMSRGASQRPQAPITLNRVRLKNRIVVPAHTTNFGERHIPSARHAEYHRQRARGGAGAIIFELVRVSDNALGRP